MQDLIVFLHSPINAKSAQIAIFAMGFNLVFGSIFAAMLMNRGDKLNRVLKYTAMAASGLIAIFFGFIQMGTWADFIYLVVISFYLYPKMTIIFHGHYCNRSTDVRAKG